MAESVDIRFKKRMEGPESVLVNDFLSVYKKNNSTINKTFTIFTEPFTGSGFPDLVIVLWDDIQIKKWHPERSNLRNIDLKILHHMMSNRRGYTMKNLQVQLGYSNKKLKCSLEKLSAASLVRHLKNDTFRVCSKNDYLVPDASWLAGLIDLCAGLKLLCKKVIVGYSSQQMLYLALAKVDAIASGAWLNVRTFSLDKFEAAEDDQQSRRTTWYYCPQSLSEYQITFLDIAKRAGILDDIKTDDSFYSEYVNVLFSGAQPTTVGISEREAFRHYLHCLKMQTGYAGQLSYDDTCKYLNMLFNTAGQLANYFKTKGVRAKYRDFSEVMDDTIAAIDLFNATRGMVYKHRWNSL